MELFVYFMGVLALAYASPVENRRYDSREEDMFRIRYLPYLDKDGNVQYEDLQNVQATPDARATAADVTYYLYTQSNTDSADVIGGNNINALSSSNFASNRKNVFVSHGWNNNFESDVNVYIKSALLNVQNVNLFVIDWSGIANGLYLTAQANVADVGSVVGDFIVSMMNTYGLSTSDFYLIGHSLGAHVAGCAGARVKSQTGSLVYSLVGLDPAGPLFTMGNTENRIDPTDGDFVHVIHTNGGLLGFSSSMGHADYFPNGGSAQEGCGWDLIGTCAHARAYIYYAESLLTSNFASRACDSYSSYLDGACANNNLSLMGEFNVDKGASGDYYLSTNEDSPFAQG